MAGRSDLVLQPGHYFSEFLYDEPLLVKYFNLQTNLTVELGYLKKKINETNQNVEELTSCSQYRLFQIEKKIKKFNDYYSRPSILHT